MSWKRLKNTVKGRIDYYYSEENEKHELLQKMRVAKTTMGEGQPTTVTTFAMLNRLLDYYILNNKEAVHTIDDNSSCATTECPPEYQTIAEDETYDENLFICGQTSFADLLEKVRHHQQECDQPLLVKTEKRIHHVLQAKVECARGHAYTWTSSPHVRGGSLLVNLRVAHGYLTSGILPNQLVRLCDGARIGSLGEKYIHEIVSGGNTGYSNVVENLTNESMSDALLEEICCSGNQSKKQ